MLNIAEPHVLSLRPYVAGRSIEAEAPIKKWAKLASNENCLGASKVALDHAKEGLLQSHFYPNANRFILVRKICEHYAKFGLRENQVALGNGTSELIVNLTRGLLSHKESVCYSWPSFIMYHLAASVQGRNEFMVSAEKDFSCDLEKMLELTKTEKEKPIKLIFIANPNNPSGNYINKDKFESFIKRLKKDVVLVIDEAYFDYVIEKDYPNGLEYALRRPRTIVLRTFSKAYGMAGLRLGFAMGDKDIIDVLCRVRDPFNVNCVVQHAAMAALSDQEHIKKSVSHNLTYRQILINELKEFGFLVNDSVANFVMAKRSKTMPSIMSLANKMMERGVIIRPLDSYGLHDWVRISVGTKDEISMLKRALINIL